LLLLLLLLLLLPPLHLHMPSRQRELWWLLLHSLWRLLLHLPLYRFRVVVVLLLLLLMLMLMLQVQLPLCRAIRSLLDCCLSNYGLSSMYCGHHQLGCQLPEQPSFLKFGARLYGRNWPCRGVIRPSLSVWNPSGWTCKVRLLYCNWHDVDRLIEFGGTASK